MNDLYINKSGLFFLERIVRSCLPTPTNGGMASREYLFSLTKNVESISFKEFRKSFPLILCPAGLYNIYDHLSQVAIKEGVAEIDAKFILAFFSGIHHIERSAKDILEEKIAEIISQEYALRDYVSHVVLPVVITEKTGEFFSGEYSNGDIVLILKNLVAFPEEKEKIKIGDIVLTHYASIIYSGVEEKNAQIMKEAQMKNSDFMSACRSISVAGIDHKKMLHFVWANKLINACKI